eukprot:757018-Hanusia_phi.AAC.1
MGKIRNSNRRIVYDFDLDAHALNTSLVLTNQDYMSIPRSRKPSAVSVNQAFHERILDNEAS